MRDRSQNFTFFLRVMLKVVDFPGVITSIYHFVSVRDFVPAVGFEKLKKSADSGRCEGPEGRMGNKN